MGRRRQGPTKKLVPSIGLETPCPHTYSEDDGLQLEVDCAMCQGAQDLNNRKCFSGVVNAMISGVAPDAIILRRFIHKRYRGGDVSAATECASVLAAINRALSSLDAVSDKRCRTCPASKERFLQFMRKKLLEDARTYSAGKFALREQLLRSMASIACENSAKCVAEAIAIADADERRE